MQSIVVRSSSLRSSYSDFYTTLHRSIISCSWGKFKILLSLKSALYTPHISFVSLVWYCRWYFSCKFWASLENLHMMKKIENRECSEAHQTTKTRVIEEENFWKIFWIFYFSLFALSINKYFSLVMGTFRIHTMNFKFSGTFYVFR